MDRPLKSVTHGQCDARPTVTFPAAGHHRHLAGTKLYCLVTEAQWHMGVNNLPRVAAQQCTGRELNLRPIDRKSNALATTLPSHPRPGLSVKPRVHVLRAQDATEPSRFFLLLYILVYFNWSFLCRHFSLALVTTATFVIHTIQLDATFAVHVQTLNDDHNAFWNSILPHD